MKLRHALLATTLFMAPGVAMAQSAWWTPPSWLATPVAQPVTGLYLSGGAGWNHADKRNATSDGGANGFFDATVGNRQGSFKFSEGWGGQVAVGWGFGNGLRAEVEGNFRDNPTSKVGGWSSRGVGSTSGNFFSGTGRMRQYGVMVNGYYDFQLPAWFPNMPIPVVPYVGGGVGWIWTDLDNVGGTRVNSVGRPGDTITVDDTAGAFGYQGIAGLAFPIPAVPGLSLTAEYRYLGTLQTKYDGVVRTASGQVPTRGKFEIDGANNHSAMLGLRYALWTPPAPVAAPPVVPQAPQAVARTYLVFFDWDRYNLTDRARQIITEAAQNARSTGSTRIEVAGHADRSGTPQYNMGLSRRRADAVAAELVRQGIQRSEITVEAFGESRPLVPTADGVREPQNRRVEIVLR
ncbi:Outer membrane protein A [Roseomonas mucosa]|jgi:OmpA-OmpF porin, OOP family|uniref:OMPC n=2 Tax=Roseomonas TaxID=125216 RepID=A0A1S8D7E6_9PROT|nr:OmpA family protein [Roseomonas mucosa]MCG7353541.1 OmpA family protein [Roseomonas mucosa]MCG7358927.1 OmpA family protein [Roseomonas mucosa]MDT8295173.1 OmpA family protein [Roseomonas mucosa]MDT8313428.1 OmpA family protein [Roseomonas mucosa]MDT8348969.1 OmpA family protein [Roseomonas mucosa]